VSFRLFLLFYFCSFPPSRCFFLRPGHGEEENPSWQSPKNSTCSSMLITLPVPSLREVLPDFSLSELNFVFSAGSEVVKYSPQPSFLRIPPPLRPLFLVSADRFSFPPYSRRSQLPESECLRGVITHQHREGAPIRGAFSLISFCFAPLSVVLTSPPVFSFPENAYEFCPHPLSFHNNKFLLKDDGNPPDPVGMTKNGFLLFPFFSERGPCPSLSLMCFPTPSRLGAGAVLCESLLPPRDRVIVI